MTVKEYVSTRIKMITKDLAKAPNEVDPIERINTAIRQLELLKRRIQESKRGE